MAGQRSQPMRLALGTPPSQGFVLDYVALNTDQTDYTFQSDTTYYVSGDYNLSSATIKGGAVIKFDSSSGSVLNVLGTVHCQTGPYRPAVFTAKDDNTIGEVIPTSTGTPSGYYGNPAIQIRSSGQNLHDLHFRYAQTGVFFYDYSAMTANVLLHTQFGNCGTAQRLEVRCVYAEDWLRRRQVRERGRWHRREIRDGFPAPRRGDRSRPGRLRGPLGCHRGRRDVDPGHRSTREGGQDGGSGEHGRRGLPLAHRTLHRARQRAERLALMTGTCLVVVENGKTIRVPPRAAAHLERKPALGGRERDLVRRKA